MFLQFIASAGIVGFIGLLALVFLTYVANTFVLLLVARAMGYWTMQFDVPRWRGQDDPMPFEAAPPIAQPQPAVPVPPVSTVSAPDAGTVPPAAPEASQQTLDWYGQPLQQTQPMEQAPEVDASAPEATPLPAVGPAPYADPEPTPDPEPEEQPQPTAPIEPGQLSGFTYTGIAAPAAPVTPSGADPSNPTTPDLLVVVPEEPPKKD